MSRRTRMAPRQQKDFLYETIRCIWIFFQFYFFFCAKRRMFQVDSWEELYIYAHSAIIFKLCALVFCDKKCRYGYSAVFGVLQLIWFGFRWTFDLKHGPDYEPFFLTFYKSGLLVHGGVLLFVFYKTTCKALVDQDDPYMTRMFSWYILALIGVESIIWF